MSKIIKSQDANLSSYQNYEYEDCNQEKLEIPDNIYPSFDENIKETLMPHNKFVKDSPFELEIQMEEKIKKADEMTLKAEVYLQQAKERSEKVFQESYEKGFKQGQEDGFKTGEL
ncbi:hypothetical protein KKB18_10805, partial [bacterium]|nr:hypothetical protein [bacterium]